MRSPFPGSLLANMRACGGKGSAAYDNPSEVSRPKSFNILGLHQFRIHCSIHLGRSIWTQAHAKITRASTPCELSQFICRRRPESISECSFPILPSGAAPGRVVSADPFFTRHREQLVALAAQHHIPAIYQWRDFAEMGGLISYGADRADIYRQPGIYVGRVLGGTKPSDLPVMQPTKFELVLTKSGQGPQPDGSSIHPAAS